MKYHSLLSRKGLSPIIAVILLLMMTIAIAGLAYTFIQRYQSGLEGTIENTTRSQQQAFKASLKIDGYNTTCTASSTVAYVRIYARNSGTEPVKNVQLFIDNALTNVTPNATLNAGTTTSWLIATGDNCSRWINGSKIIKIESDETTEERPLTFVCTTGSC